MPFGEMKYGVGGGVDAFRELEKSVVLFWCGEVDFCFAQKGAAFMFGEEEGRWLCLLNEEGLMGEGVEEVVDDVCDVFVIEGMVKIRHKEYSFVWCGAWFFGNQREGVAKV